MIILKKNIVVGYVKCIQLALDIRHQQKNTSYSFAIHYKGI